MAEAAVGDGAVGGCLVAPEEHKVELLARGSASLKLLETAR